MLERLIAIIGSPAVGKTTLTLQVTRMMPGCVVFRLREHVPDTILAATATSADRLGWIDDLTVARALRGYLKKVTYAGRVHTVLLDNFPGSGGQVRLLIGIAGRIAPAAIVHAVELAAESAVLNERVRNRRVCHRCERDPIRDPRLPAQARPDDPRHCADCGGILHPRRGDAPRLLAARTRRYEQEALGIRQAFTEAGIEVMPLDSTRSAEETASDLSLLLPTRSTPR